MIATAGYASFSGDTELSRFAFTRRNPGPRDVQIDILFCGIELIPIQAVSEAYERLLMDAVRGNASLFMRRDEVEATELLGHQTLDRM